MYFALTSAKHMAMLDVVEGSLQALKLNNHPDVRLRPFNSSSLRVHSHTGRDEQTTR
jgi:hypothetical protein